MDGDLHVGESDGVKSDDLNLLDSSISINPNSPSSVSDTESVSQALGCQMLIKSPQDVSEDFDDVPIEGGNGTCHT